MCKMARYCNSNCQKAHRLDHKKECKKRAAELHHEEALYSYNLHQKWWVSNMYIWYLYHHVQEEKSIKHAAVKLCVVGVPMYATILWVIKMALMIYCPFCRKLHHTKLRKIYNNKRLMKRMWVSQWCYNALYNLGCLYDTGEEGSFSARPLHKCT